jgi:UDP-N-acetylglucosamine--N-acetylmuramyl-(pentapeptide) pyrophosphoryl-undecaprenol N-acetylglucosamine transferase
MTRRTILFQPPNHIGLGHISRLIAVALAVRDAGSNCRLPFVIEGHGHGLVEAHGLPWLSVPSRHELEETPNWAAFDKASRRLLAFDLALSLVQVLAPDLIVFDCLPNPAMLNAALERQVPIAICLRKAKDMCLYFEQIAALTPAIQLILIAHDEGECEVPAELRSRTRFTGPIARPCPAVRARASQTHAGPLVVITGGGGGYPGCVDFYNLALAAFAHARRQQPNLNGALIAGPLFTDWWQLRLVEGIRCLPFDPHLSETLADAGLVVCQAGYNTVTEIASLGVPALCMPAERVVDDQFERARAAASSSFQVYEGTDVEELARRLLNGVRTGQTNQSVIRSLRPMPGARIAAESLLALLDAVATGEPSTRGGTHAGFHPRDSSALRHAVGQRRRDAVPGAGDWRQHRDLLDHQ